MASSTTTRPKTVADVMTKEPVCVNGGMSIRELREVFADNEISGAPVIGTNGEVIGVVSLTDLIREISEGTLDVPPAFMFEELREQSDADMEIEPEYDVTVDDFMTPDPVTVTADESISKVARLMGENQIHRVVVVDDKNFPVGIVTSLDVLRAWPR